MPIYEYQCPKCEKIEDHMHSMSESPKVACPDCKKTMNRLISANFNIVSGGWNGTIQSRKDADRQKKIKDLDRAVKMRKKMFGSDAVGNPVDKADPKHVVRRGKTIAGQQMDIDKRELTKALAKDDLAVAKAKEVLDKKKK